MMSMAISGAAGSGTAQAMSGASMRMPPAQKMAHVFAKIDTSGSGTISKSQFEQAFQSLKMPASFKAMGADAVFSKLDANSTGSVSKQDFVSSMKSSISQMRQGGSSHGVSQTATPPPSVTPPAQTLTYNLKSLDMLGGSQPSASGMRIRLSA